MEDKTILAITGIICITILEAINMMMYHVDGAILSAIVGAIVFIITRKVYLGTGSFPEKKTLR